MKSTFRLSPNALRLIRKYAADRRDATTIARLMYCSPATIDSICREHGIELVKISDGAPPLSQYKPSRNDPVRFITVEVPIGSEAMELIRREAVRRGCRPAMLVSRLAEIVAMDGIFAAVLDK